MHFKLDRRAFVSDAQLAEARALPGAVEIRDRTVAMEYDVEDTGAGPLAVVRLRLPEKLARTLVQEEVPVLDRPVRFVVPRGQRGSVRADDLATLHDKLDRPFTEDEAARTAPASREEQDGQRREKVVREVRGEFQRNSKHGRRGGPGGAGGRGHGGRKRR
jgi:hypothetical protein